MANEQYPGGQLTHNKPISRFSFSQANPKLSIDTKLDFEIGKAIFDKIWVFAPSSTTASDGLGPLYNARSCVRCHKGNGRGIIEGSNSSSPALFLRLSIPPTTEHHLKLLASGKFGFIPEPVYGKQLQTFAYPGGQAEGQLKVQYHSVLLNIKDGSSTTQVELLNPEYKILDAAYGQLAPNLLFSPRIAPPVIGLGLIEAIDEHDILAFADPKDLNNDGISGKANIVWDYQSQSSKLGRYGWKAGSPTLDQQNNAAFSGDIGISSWLFTNHAGDCTTKQAECLQQSHGNKRREKPNKDYLEAPKAMTDLVLFYTKNIALPLARNIHDSKRKKGKALFHKAGCHKCHRPSYTTKPDPDLGLTTKQKIWPYSDFLLHDMGKGLADNRSEFLANGQEWRTPPLWGIGLTRAVSENTFFLHDGRARNLLEAILWHGGEAEQSKQFVVNITHQQRQQLIFFLESI